VADRGVHGPLAAGPSGPPPSRGARPERALLVLEDGSAFEGLGFGAAVEAQGEVVFNTSMTGYQEILTDPSYAGQIVVLTYPLIGNYGVNPFDFESRRIQVRGLVVRWHCDRPSHWQGERTVHGFLTAEGVPALSEVDTRAITRRLRTRGVMMGLLTRGASAPEALERLRQAPRYGDIDFVTRVTTPEVYAWGDEGERQVSGGVLRIAVLDLGLKYNILRILQSRGCQVVAMPAQTSAEEVLAARPHGVVLSPGPGDPALLEYAAATARRLLGRAPIFGICLGHQVLAHALGGRTYKLKFGHRGANHPVRDLEAGAVHITAQNHGYAVDADSLHGPVMVSHVNLNDDTVEGMRHRELPMLSIQYHSEAAPGPQDNAYMFDRFLALVRDARK